MDNFKDKKTDDILEKLVHINRITKVVKGGRRFGFSALVVVGNQAGKIGIAIVSTPKGVMTDIDARKQRVGGEIICKVF